MLFQLRVSQILRAQVPSTSPPKFQLEVAAVTGFLTKYVMGPADKQAFSSLDGKALDMQLVHIKETSDQNCNNYFANQCIPKTKMFVYKHDRTEISSMRKDTLGKKIDVALEELGEVKGCEAKEHMR